MAFKANDFQVSLYKRLAELHDVDKDKKYYIELSKKQTPEIIRMKKYMDVFQEILYVKHVENYINYVAGITYQIFVAKPETLRSSENITIKEALSHETIEHLILYVSERKVNELSYLSLTDLNKYFDDRFGIQLAKENDLHNLVIAIEVRNLAVHNRSIINQRYVNRLKISYEKIGTKRIIDHDELLELSSLLFRCVKSLDEEVKTKFGLKGIRFRMNDN
jgi:hypothetical protein